MVGITTGGSAGYSRYAYMNRRGRIVFKLTDNVTAEGDFYEGRAQVYVAKSQTVRVHIDDEVIKMEEDISARGYIDRTGRLVIPARFSRVGTFRKVWLWSGDEGYRLTITTSPERWKRRPDNEAVLPYRSPWPSRNANCDDRCTMSWSWFAPYGRRLAETLSAVFISARPRRPADGVRLSTGPANCLDSTCGPGVVAPGAWRGDLALLSQRNSFGRKRYGVMAALMRGKSMTCRMGASFLGLGPGPGHRPVNSTGT
jgi:hypothetical protein